MAHIIDGKKIAAETRNDISRRVAEFENENGFKPGLAVIIVGENPGSKYDKALKLNIPIWSEEDLENSL